MSAKKCELVVKSNRLVEASYRLDLDEQRVILAAIVAARETQSGLDGDFVTIEARAFAGIFGIDERSVYQQMKAALDSLYERSITIKDVDPETGKARTTRMRWLTQQSYIDGAGRLQLQFSPKVVPYITRLESEFSSYEIQQISGLSSTHAIRIYEILVQYLPVGVRVVEVQWLKETLEITAMYPAIKDLKKRVIDAAVEQINERTDLNVSYDQRKTGRAVTHLVFKVKTKRRKPEGQRQQRLDLGDDYVAQRAHPGESWEQARKRLMEEKNATK